MLFGGGGESGAPARRGLRVSPHHNPHLLTATGLPLPLISRLQHLLAAIVLINQTDDFALHCCKVACSIMILQQLSGINAVNMFAAKILGDAGVEDPQENTKFIHV